MAEFVLVTDAGNNLPIAHQLEAAGADCAVVMGRRDGPGRGEGMLRGGIRTERDVSEGVVLVDGEVAYKAGKGAVVMGEATKARSVISGARSKFDFAQSAGLPVGTIASASNCTELRSLLTGADVQLSVFGEAAGQHMGMTERYRGEALHVLGEMKGTADVVIRPAEDRISWLDVIGYFNGERFTQFFHRQVFGDDVDTRKSFVWVPDSQDLKETPHPRWTSLAKPLNRLEYVGPIRFRLNGSTLLFEDVFFGFDADVEIAISKLTRREYPDLIKRLYSGGMNDADVVCVMRLASPMLAPPVEVMGVKARGGICFVGAKRGKKDRLEATDRRLGFAYAVGSERKEAEVDALRFALAVHHPGLLFAREVGAWSSRRAR